MTDPKPRRILVVVLEGADLGFVRADRERGELPALRSLHERGCFAPLRTALPMHPATQMASLVTGEHAVAHGVFGACVERRGELFDAAAMPLRVPPVWDMLATAGKKVLLLNWPRAWGGELPGVGRVAEQAVVAGVLGTPLAGQDIDPELAERLDEFAHPVADITDAELAPFVPDATVRPVETRVLQALREVLAETVTVHNLATWALEEDSHDACVVRFRALHILGRDFVRGPDPDHPGELDDPFRYVWSGFHRFLDLLLGRLVELAGDETNVMVVSPFGMHRGRGRLSGPVRPQDLYRQQGFLAAAGPGVREEAVSVGASLLDVVPTLLRLAGTSEGRDMPGRPLSEVFAIESRSATVESWHSIMPGPGRSADSSAPLTFTDEEARRTRAGLDLGRAQSLVATGQAPRALDLLDELLDADPEAAEPVRVLAHLLLGQGDLDRAAELFDELQRRGGSEFDYRLGAARVASARNRHDEALDHLFAMLALKPDHALVHHFVAEEYVRLGRPDDAMEAYRRGIGHDPGQVQSHLGLSALLFERGAHEAAAQSALDAVEHDFGNAAAHHRLALAMQALGRNELAIKAFEATLRYQPGQVEVHEALGRLYREPPAPDESLAMRHDRRAMKLRAKQAQRG